MNELPFYPGPTPQDETAISGQASFIEACKVEIARNAEAGDFGWRLGNSLLTRRRDGTLVWRVDVSGNFGTRSRMVFWQPPGSDSDEFGFAYIPGQDLEELN
jgi:hypothetical protein